MRIAFHIGALPAKQNQWSIADWFKFEVVSRFLSLHQDGQYLLLSDEPVEKFFPKTDNMEYLVLGKYNPHVLTMYRRFNYKIPAALKHAGSEVLVSLSGILPLKNKIPSCLLLSDEEVSTKKADLREGLQRYRKRYLPRFLQQAKQVVTLSDCTEKQLLSAYQFPKHRISLIGRCVPDLFTALDWDSREAVKTQYADGEEFLLYAGELSKENNIINLLKAFSVLKKKMNSSMVLVLAGKQDPAFKKFPKLFDTYHFRKAVKLTGELPLAEIAHLTGGAYARIIPAVGIDFCSAIPNALQCCTPVIAADSPLHRETGGEAALYFKQDDFEALGEQLCALYKNEELRSRLITRSDEKAKDFSWDKIASLFWEAVVKTTKEQQ